MRPRETVSEIRRMLRLFWPIICGQLAFNSMSVVDTVMAGAAGPLELSGVAIGASLFFPLLFTMVGLSSAIQPITAFLTGAGRQDEIPDRLHQITVVCLILSLALSALVALIPQVYRFIPADGAMIAVATGYLYALAPAVPLMILFNVLRGYCEGLGITAPTLWFGFIQLFLNIPLNYVFIFGRLGVPAFGGIGCGIASALTAALSAVLFVAYIEISPRFARVRLYRRWYPLSRAYIRRFLKLGVPLALSATMEMACFATAALILSPFGPAVVSAHTITLNISGMLFMLPLSVAVVSTIRTGMAMGAGDWHRCALTVRAGFIISGFFYICSTLLLLFGRHFLAGLYSDDEEIIALTASLLLLNCLYLLPDHIQMECIGILRGFKDSRTIFCVTLVSYWVIGMPLGVSLAWGLCGEPLKAYGIWIGFTGALTAAMAIYAARLAVLFKTRRLPRALRL